MKQGQIKRSPKRAQATAQSVVGNVPSEQDIAHRLTFLLTRIVALLMDNVSDDFRELGVTIPEARTLIAIFEFGNVPVGQLAEVTSIDLSSMSHLLRRLEAASFVDRVRPTHDNRVVLVSLTKRGLALAQQCREASLEHERIMISDMSKSDEKTLKKLLDQVYQSGRKALADRGTKKPATMRRRHISVSREE